ncbi:hypothetical protein M7I_6608 [Glarea lozoyensis 74030]|uniref:Uncharacterized protein n=1 Tax=Glarea lozoyensis (strain ATCC 74030 / MF5533) TaxID=1104152 RepID=H0EV16_GLAL7|nr:hypothetical protein M7I_6608 [Glarea lozoyensis 74030]
MRNGVCAELGIQFDCSKGNKEHECHSRTFSTWLLDLGKDARW